MTKIKDDDFYELMKAINDINRLVDEIDDVVKTANKIFEKICENSI